MEIVDPADVDASGEGLETAEVNRRATFNVDIGRNGSSRDLKVQIRCTTFSFILIIIVIIIILSDGKGYKTHRAGLRSNGA